MFPHAQLLAILLAYNPYSSNLELKVNELKSKQAEDELRAMSPSLPSPTGEEGGGTEPGNPDGESGRRERALLKGFRGKDCWASCG